MHEREIRKDMGPFSVLRDRTRKQAFIQALTDVLDRTPMTVCSAVIDKRQLAEHRRREENPYELSLRFCLERIFYSLRRLGQTSDAEGPVLMHVLCESRGRNEDADLELAFRRICGGDNFGTIHLPFEPVLTDKKNNSIGLQLADLVARPIGLKQLRPSQSNRAWDVIERKLDRDPLGRYIGYGLKCFP